MKHIFYLALTIFCLNSYATLFVPHLDPDSGHELVWNFNQDVSGWGKTDRNQIKLKCAQFSPAIEVDWSNARTLKVRFKENLAPGSKCAGELNLSGHKDPFTFQVPLAKVVSIGPWNFDSLDEDTSFVLSFDSNVSAQSIAQSSYIEVEGLEEKISLNAVEDHNRKEILKISGMLDHAKNVVLAPRRAFPPGKQIAFVLTEGSAFGFTKQGRIRLPFSASMSCDRGNPDSPCSPIGTAALTFNSEVSNDFLRKIKLTSNGKSQTPSIEGDGYGTFVSFPLNFQSQTEFELEIPDSVIDLSGRILENQKKFPLKFKTGDLPVLAKFPGQFGILEANIAPLLPVTVRNIEKNVSFTKTTAVLKLKNPVILMQWLKAIEKRQGIAYPLDLRDKSIFDGSKIARTDEILEYRAGKNEMEVLGLPLKGKGLHLVELHSPMVAGELLGVEKNFHISTAALVTNLAAHFKIGSSNSLVWVTTLDQGHPVPGADVVIYNCKGEAIDKGKTNAQGFITLLKTTKSKQTCVGPVDTFNDKLIAVANMGDDSTFTQSDWNEGIEPWRYSVYDWYNENPLRAHTVFDRPIYKQGEKVHMLHLLRSQIDSGVKFSKEHFGTLRISHSESGNYWDLKLDWKKGAATTLFSVPKEAPHGTYYLSLINLKDGRIVKELEAGSFKVDDFRVPLMRSDLQFKDKRESFVSNDSVTILGHLEFLAGGASSDTSVTLRTEISPQYSSYFPDYENYRFFYGNSDSSQEEATKTLDPSTTISDKDGNFKFILPKIPSKKQLLNASFEIEYLDPNGLFQTNSLYATIYPYDRLIGIRPPEDISTKVSSTFNVVILDHKKKPVEAENFSGTLYKIVTSTSRKKILGGFYTYDNSQRKEKIGKVCDGKTDFHGKGTCSFMSSQAGSYELVIETKSSMSYINFYNYGSNNMWDPQEYHDRMDLIADKKEYQAGQTARYELKLPFEAAKVLITKERSGIKKAYVVDYSRKNPFISVPVEIDDFPNVYISALAVRGRLASGQATGIVDLARPAYRLGLVELKVSKNENTLKLSLQTDKSTYHPGDKVRLIIKGPKNGTVAISVFDEGLLLLNSMRSFDVEDSLIQSYNYQITTATAQGHIIGKRHFGLKARPHGGGGGRDLKTRELFDTLIYWSPATILNKDGEAVVEFKLNDSLTSFKIYGLAYSESSFGTTDIRITSNKDVMTFVATAPSVRTGDEFQASYVLKNITSRPMNLSATLSLNEKVIATQGIALTPTGSYNLKIPVASFKTSGVATYFLMIKEGGKIIDQIKTIQNVLPLYTPRVIFTDLKEVDGVVSVPGNITERRLSGIEILLSGSLLPNQQALQSFMRQYEYHCLEQEISRAIVLNDKKLLSKIDSEISSYTDEQGLLKYYPSETALSSLELTSHILEVTHWSSSELSKASRLEEALSKFIKGEISSSSFWEEKNFPALRLKAMVALKVRGSKLFNQNWLSEIKAPAENDSTATLLDKWVLFHPEVNSSKAQELITRKLQIDGSTVTFPTQETDFTGLLVTPEALWARFLIIQKSFPLKGGFDDFFEANEVKFLRGYSTLKLRSTFSNLYAHLLGRYWKAQTITGKTLIAGRQTQWKDNRAPTINLNHDEARLNQSISHSGSGKPWASLRYLAYPDPSAQEFNGIEISQKISASEFKVQDRIKLVLTIKSNSNVSLPGVRIPLPAGVSILNASASDHLSLVYEERTEHEWRGYLNDLPKGEHQIELTFRLNQEGNFEIPGSRVEALYSPEVFGELPYWGMQIKP